MKTVYKSLVKSLRMQKAVALITLIEDGGIDYRTAGTKMLVWADGSSFGSVGGGFQEAQAVEKAQEFLRKKLEEKRVKTAIFSIEVFQDDALAKEDEAKISIGALRFLIECIPFSDEHLALYESIVRAERAGQLGTLVTCIDLKSGEAQKSCVSKKHLFIILENEATSILPQKVIEYASCLKKTRPHSLVLDDFEYIIEPLARPHSVHIVGSGHVACELARVLYYLGFYNVVLDDRPQFANEERFPKAEIVLLPSLECESFADYFASKELCLYDAVVIVSRGFDEDKQALEASLKTKASFIGMIGNVAKKENICSYLALQGFTQRDFDRVHTPIGLSIEAQSPEEVALSIGAQMIEWRVKSLSGNKLSN